ncbi:unnamed protein product [Trichogramma brassicae]|uniref:non-specific serine/threonine protein kinase n=1 Tax=Trichogramma brassicae TaxID=86971 RepID=A0A6H5ITF4_9HYME|nr:unnamed protein product [Trichogramma brassicae]
MSLHALSRIKLRFVTTTVVIVLHADVLVVGPRPPPPPPDSSGRVILLLLSSSSTWLVPFKCEDREYAYGTAIPPRSLRYRCSALTCCSGAEDVHYYGYFMMSDDDDKPPAPPVRLTSNRCDPNSLVDMRPLPKEPDAEDKRKKNAKNKIKLKDSKDKPNISYPTNFEHTVHVGFDNMTGEFTGMPQAWARLLMSSNISKQEQKENPQAVLDVLKCMSSSTDEVDDDNSDEKNVSTTSIASCSSSSSSSSFDSTARESSLQLRQIHEIPREIGGVPLPRLEPPAPAEFGSLVIKDSRGPHIGNTIIYEQPITIRQIVYANGTAAAAGREDSERDDVSSCPSSVDEKRYYEKKRSPTTIDKSDGFVRANDFVERKKRLYVYAAIGAMSIVIIVAVTLGVTLLRSVKKSVDESVNEPSDHAIVTTEVAVVDVPHDEPTKPPKEEEAISWLVNRTSWLARPARRTRPLALSPVPYLIVSETSDDRSGCLDGDSCRRAIRRRQLYDLDSLGRDDIGPSFLVGGDGNVYEGRGWWVAGQHTGPGYDERSLGLAFVGQLDSAAAAASCQRQIEAARGFIELAVARGRLAENYRVYAEKQLRVGSTSPGERLYAALKNWTHWSPIAPSIDDFL